MLGTVQKLLKKENLEVKEKYNITKLGTPVIKYSRQRVAHKIWLCSNCGHLYFYAVLKCPLCESKKIKTAVYGSKNTLEEDVVIKNGGFV